jgi:hypothetical protein
MDTGRESDYDLLLTSHKRIRLIEKFSLKEDLNSELASCY